MIQKNLLGVCFIFLSVFASAQHGLEKIIVEKYYISDAKDSTALGGHLPVGSVTYRIFVDMLPDYKFEAAYGVPGHELRLATTTKFFNNEDYGSEVPNTIPDRNLKDYTVMLDSWLSAGGASENNYGILKTDDDTVETIVNQRGFLQSENYKAGIPIKKKDGLIQGLPPRVTVFGIDSTIKIFNNQTISSLFSTTNGSWATLYGAKGVDSLTNNRVLIAQITTDGVFSFELNIQIASPYGGVEQYVAKNPVGEEIFLSSLTYNSALDIASQDNTKPFLKKKNIPKESNN